MCVVIDVNTLAAVFNEAAENHSDFSPVKDWIFEGHGFVVFGGTTYKRELQKTERYLRLIRTLKDSGKAISIRDQEVDMQESKVKKATLGSQCDDQHIIALLGAAQCGLLCSGDSRSFKFIKDRSLYPKGTPRVKIYTSAKHQVLLKKTSPRKLQNVE